MEHTQPLRDGTTILQPQTPDADQLAQPCQTRDVAPDSLASLLEQFKHNCDVADTLFFYMSRKADALEQMDDALENALAALEKIEAFSSSEPASRDLAGRWKRLADLFQDGWHCAMRLDSPGFAYSYAVNSAQASQKALRHLSAQSTRASSSAINILIGLAHLTQSMEAELSLNDLAELGSCDDTPSPESLLRTVWLSPEVAWGLDEAEKDPVTDVLAKLNRHDMFEAEDEFLFWLLARFPAVSKTLRSVIPLPEADVDLWNSFERRYTARGRATTRSDDRHLRP